MQSEVHCSFEPYISICWVEMELNVAARPPLRQPLRGRSGTCRHMILDRQQQATRCAANPHPDRSLVRSERPNVVESLGDHLKGSHGSVEVSTGA